MPYHPVDGGASRFWLSSYWPDTIFPPAQAGKYFEVRFARDCGPRRSPAFASRWFSIPAWPVGFLAVSRGLLEAGTRHPTAGLRAQFQRPFWQSAILAITQRLPEAKLASKTKNQLIEHIELRAPSNFQVLTPKIQASSSKGLALANCTVFAAKTPTNWLA